MFFVPRRQIWTQQPQTEAAVADEYLALAPKLIVNYGASPNDLVSSKFPVAVNRAYGVDAQGKGLKGSSGVAQYASRLTGKYLTLVISVTPGAYAGVYQMLFETEVATSARTEGTLMVLPYYDNVAAASGWWSVSLFPSDGVNYTYGTIKFPAPSANIPHTLVVRVDRNLTGPAKVLSVHVDGMAQVLTPSGINNTQGSNSNFNANNIYINQRAGALLPGSHNVHFVGVFGSLFSSEKAKSLSDNPWQIFKRPDSRIFVPVSAGGTTTSLIVQDATHAHIADSPSFSMATYLAVAESLHAHAADNVTLATTGTANLVVQEATHAHVADGVTLTTQWLLAVAEALHSHTAESVTLSLQTALVVLEALHTHAAENLTLGVTGTANLTIADATSGHTSDTVAFTLNSLLAVFDAIHTHTADNLTLDTSNATALTVQDSTHAHGADNLGLSLDTWLAIVDAAHTHTADAPTLSASVALLIAEALHAHYADVAVLSLPGETTLTPEDITAIAAAVLAAINATTIPVNATHLNGAPIIGTGTLRDDWRGVGVPPQ